MKRDLQYFEIEGAFGGNQDWFTNIVMNIGGCAAATACDCCIYLGLRRGLEELYPYDVHRLTSEDYVRFSQRMKPYIRPRIQGVRKLEWFIEGFDAYVRDVNKASGREIKLRFGAFPGSRSYEEARELVIRQIEKGYPIPCLLLKHRLAEKYKDYIWHWFLLVGYEEAGNDLLVKTATYGESEMISLREFWDTGERERGGLIELGTGYF